METNREPVPTEQSFLRGAEVADVPAICRFGENHIQAHYAPLIGEEAAEGQVRSWWGAVTIRTAVTEGLVVVAGQGGTLTGVGQRGRRGTDHVIYKLYVHPQYRGQGLGRRLLDALIKGLPVDARRVYIEHFISNKRAGAFYEREGFAVDRIEESPTGSRALSVVWRSRDLAPHR